MAAVEPTVPAGSAPGEKGLKGDALGLMSSIVIGVASTAPGDSLAAAAEVGAGLIVVGTVGENPISGALLGSVVLKFVQRSSVPLLVVPTQEG